MKHINRKTSLDSALQDTDSWSEETVLQLCIHSQDTDVKIIDDESVSE